MCLSICFPLVVAVTRLASGARLCLHFHDADADADVDAENGLRDPRSRACRSDRVLHAAQRAEHIPAVMPGATTIEAPDLFARAHPWQHVVQAFS